MNINSNPNVSSDPRAPVNINTNVNPLTTNQAPTNNQATKNENPLQDNVTVNTNNNVQNIPTNNTNTSNTTNPVQTENINNPNNQINSNISKFSSLIGNPFEQNPLYNTPYLNYYDPNTVYNSGVNNNSLWKYLLAGGLGFLTGAALSSMMFYSYPLCYPMYYSYYYSPCWYSFCPGWYNWWGWF